jgi:hypothetical protein
VATVQHIKPTSYDVEESSSDVLTGFIASALGGVAALVRRTGRRKNSGCS